MLKTYHKVGRWKLVAEAILPENLVSVFAVRCDHSSDKLSELRIAHTIGGQVELIEWQLFRLC